MTWHFCHFSLCPSRKNLKSKLKIKILVDPGLLRTYLTEIYFLKNGLPKHVAAAVGQFSNSLLQGWGLTKVFSFCPSCLRTSARSSHTRKAAKPAAERGCLPRANDIGPRLRPPRGPGADTKAELGSKVKSSPALPSDLTLFCGLSEPQWGNTLRGHWG